LVGNGVEALMDDRGQLGFAEAFVSAGLGRNAKLERLDGLIEWGPAAHRSPALRSAVDVQGVVATGVLRPVGPGA